MAKKPAGNQIIDPEQKKLFIEMRDHWSGLDQRAKSAAGKRRQYEKEAKSAGFSAAMFEDSLHMATPEGEAEFKAEIANRLLAAAYSDADVGDQLSLFLDHDRTPAVDRAYKEGETRAMENKTLQCKYDPDTEQYRAFTEGYHAEQERQVKKGIKKLEPDAKANGKAPKADKSSKKGTKAAKPAKGAKRGPGRPPKAAAAAPKDDAPPRRPSAAPATRASLAADKAKDAAPAESYFSKSTEPAGNA